jgi:uncharacterized protein YkwD
MDQFLSRRIRNKRLPFVHIVALVAPAWWGMACSGEDTPPTLGQGGSPGTGGGSTVTSGGSTTPTNGGTSTTNGGSTGTTSGGTTTSGGSTATTSGGTTTSGGSATNGGKAATSGGATSGGSGGKGSSGAGTTGGSGGSATTGGASSMGGSGGGVTGDRATKEGVCARWKADRANMSEGTWSGDTASCNQGDISADGRANALRLYNLYRWLADLPAVQTEASRDSMAQACALMQYANNSLSHDPPTTWKCYTEEGAKGSSQSNISGGPGVSSVDNYMLDNGNATTIGHRRWILSNSLGPIGLGSTAKGSSCMQNLTGTGKAGKPWQAWPPPGIVPIQAFGNGRSTIDTTGWTIQSDSINLSGATVTVTAGGAAAAMTVTQLSGGYGSKYAFRMNPSGWTSKAGTTYAVSVTGIPTPISYNVEVVDCP